MPELVTILAVDDLSLAHLAKSQLEAADIPCFLQNEYMVGVNWMYANALGGICLQVPAVVAEEALAVLAGEEQFAELAANVKRNEEIDSTGCSAQDENEDDKENDICPRCHSLDIEGRSLRRPFGALSLLLGFPLPFAPGWHKCLTCGHRWR